jgi:acetyl-CoA acetyltransferase
MLGFQAEGAAPLVLGEPVAHPETVASAIRIGNPARWEEAMGAVTGSRGAVRAVSDEEILDAWRFLAAREGVFCEPASAASNCTVVDLMPAFWQALAGKNPAAQMRQPITIDDVINSKMIAHPLHLLDCSLVSDGGAAVIMTSAERAKDFKKKPVYMLGVGEGHSHEHVSQAQSLTTSAAKEAGERAYAMAGLGPKDMDVAELYDCFTPVVIIELEDLGFCPKGEGGRFVEGGRVELGGELPINTHGGLMSHCHPGHPGSLFSITEAVRQLRGECGPRQVKDAEVAFVHGQGGIMSTHCSMILGKERN